MAFFVTAIPTLFLPLIPIHQVRNYLNDEIWYSTYMSNEDDIEFMQAYLKGLQKGLAQLHDLMPCDDPNWDPYELPVTSPDDERAALIADSLNMDGNLFRDWVPHPGDTWNNWWRRTYKRLLRRIDVAREIITKLLQAKTELATPIEPATPTEPTDLIHLAKAVELYHVSRGTIKRDIKSGKIKSYRKNPRGKHEVSLAEIDLRYPRR